MEMQSQTWLSDSHIFFFPAMIKICIPPGLPRWLSGKEFACQCRRYRTQVFHPGWEDPLERKEQPTPVFLPWKSNGQRSLEDHSSWEQRVRYNWTHRHTHTISCKGTYFVLIGQLFIFLLKFSFLCFRWLVTYHPTASVHEHENGVCD